MEGDGERLCLISSANVSDGSYLALCSTTVYYPKVAGWCREEERTGSPFVIHHSGGLLPLLSDCNMDKCSSCLQMPTHLNEQQAKKMIPLLSISVQVSQREGKKHHVILAHLDVQKDTQTDVNITSTGYSCEKEKGK